MLILGNSTIKSNLLNPCSFEFGFLTSLTFYWLAQAFYLYGMTNEEIQQNIDQLFEDLLTELEKYKEAIHVSQQIDRNLISAKIKVIECKILELRELKRKRACH